MAEERAQRRLVSILAADVVGFASLNERDEAGTFERLRNHRKELFEPAIARYRGHIFKLTGDGLLAEFGSVVDAVECAVAMQQGMVERNGGAADDCRIDIRIGVNLGDVIVEGDDRHGDGVIIATRLEALAEPGGICLSAKVHEEVGSKTNLHFEDLGDHSLKNISRPVHVFRVAGPGRQPTPPAHQQLPPSRVSIAVLPFDNLSDDPSQQYFSDGITEDIITELSRFHDLYVLAHNASFQFRGKAIDVNRVGRELGAQYLVEGSVRKRGDRIRITAQLIETKSGHHVWAERFDRNQEELFAVQDQVVRTIAATLVGRLQAADAEQAKRKPPASLAAYECVLSGYALPVGDREAVAEARRLFEKAIALDPNYARAYGLLAHSYASEWFRDMSGSDILLDRAFELARKAAALGENEGNCQMILGKLHYLRRSYGPAEHQCLKALELNRNSPALVAELGQLYVYLGRPVEGLERLGEAKLLDPFFDPSWYWPFVGVAHFVARHYEEAIVSLSRTSSLPYWAQPYLTACYGLANRPDLAKQQAAEVVRLIPQFSLNRFAEREPFKASTDRQHLVDGLRKAGLPE